MEADDIIKTRLESILTILDERQRRMYLSVEAASIGWGGKSKISELSSVTRRTIAKGEVESSLRNRITAFREIRRPKKEESLLIGMHSLFS